MRFIVRNKSGGKSGGKTMVGDVPAFDWESFKNTPNAEAFVKKAYFSEARKIIREINEGGGRSAQHHLDSVENVIARSLRFTQIEIKDWCESRDWGRSKLPPKSIEFLKKSLPLLATTEGFQDHLREQAAQIIADVSDVGADPIADYLFTKITMERRSDIALYDLL
jgi:hypothetical protein